MELKKGSSHGGEICYSAAMSILNDCLDDGSFVAFDCWSWDSNSGHIKYVPTFHYELDSSLYLWMLESAARYFKIGQDLPGRIFQNGTYEECTDISALAPEKEIFSRKQKAIQNNLFTYLGVPIFKNAGNCSTVNYVLAFYGKEKPEDYLVWSTKVKKVLDRMYSTTHMCEWMDFRLSLEQDSKSKRPRRRRPQVKQKCTRNDENCSCRLCIVKRNNREYARRSQRRRAQAVAELPVLHEKIEKQNSQIRELTHTNEELRRMLIQAVDRIQQINSQEKIICTQYSDSKSIIYH